MTIATTLQDALGLRFPPIAVSFVDAPPADVPRFVGAVPAGCAFWERAASGPFATVTADHELCAIGVHTHNLPDAAPRVAGDLAKSLQVMAQLDYVREDEVAAIPVVQRSARSVVYAPLAQAPVAPDVVLLLVHARQSLVLSEAVSRVESGTPPAMGRPACAVIPQVMNTGRAAMSLGCCGARAYLEAMRDDVAIWGLPGPRIEVYAAQIAVLGRANDVLAQFHTLRRKSVEAGHQPTVVESLAAMQSQ